MPLKRRDLDGVRLITSRHHDGLKIPYKNKDYLLLDPFFEENSISIPIKTNDRFIYPVYNSEVLTFTMGRIAQKSKCMFKKRIPGRIHD